MMSTSNLPEVWLRGPVDSVPSVLQPVAHALLQANEEIHAMLADFPESRMWTRSLGMASVAFHVQHIAGVLDRLFTYASGSPLSAEQLQYLSTEGIENPDIRLATLLQHLDRQIHASIDYLKKTDPLTVTNMREVGRKKLPSTVLGLLFHSAEHTMRHTGQLLVTSRLAQQL